MPRLLISTFTTLMLGSLVAITPGAPIPESAKKPAFYFPVEKGAKWVYSVDDKETTEVVVAVAQKNDAYIVRVDTVSGGEGSPFQTIEVSAKGLCRLEFDGEAFNPPVWLCKIPATKGLQWPVNSIRHVDAYSGTRAVRGEERVEVAAGTFSTVKVVWDWSLNGDPPRQTTSWYAPGVGLIKTESGTLKKALKSFTPGKD